MYDKCAIDAKNAKDESTSEHPAAYLTTLSPKTKIGEVLQQHCSNTLTLPPTLTIIVNDLVILRGGEYLNPAGDSTIFSKSILQIKQMHPEIVERTGGGLADLGFFIAMSDLFEPHDTGDGLVAHTGWLNGMEVLWTIGQLPAGGRLA
eukprot:8773326-Pyramimonas_sp.AAC.2